MSEVEMEDNENRDEQLINDGQVPVDILSDSEIEHQQEKSPPASIPDDQNPDEMKSADNKLDEVENENPIQNGVEDQNMISDDEQQELPMKEEDQNMISIEQQELLMKEEDQVEVEHSVVVPYEHDNDDQDDSERTEVEENGIEGVDVAENQQDPVTPTSLMMCSSAKADDDSKGLSNNWLESKIMEDDEDGSPEEQAAFMKELECFYRERAMEFKPPKFYQQPLNCLKLWRAVIRLGGYDLVTGTKLWRQVGVSFHPPKTCTTISWTFRNFYEKALLEYERYKCQNGELEFSAVARPESSSVGNEANGYQGPGLSGRERRDAASRAMQGWHVQKLFGGEVGEPTSKDKNFNNMPKREKSLKSIGSVKHKRPAEMEHTIKAARTEMGKQLIITVEDAGPPADWVKINVREAKDCFEVYGLVPGLLREEVRVQSDPAGRLVITGQPEQPDNPWGITAFRKVVNFPARIDPLNTSAVVSLHGRLYVRVPFEESDDI